MQNRRKFISQSATLAFGGSLLSKALFANPASAFKPRPLGLQLFTFFSTIDQDVPGTLKKIKDAGYTEIESAFSRKGGYYGMSAKEFDKMLRDMGLSWKSHHVTGAPFRMPANAKPPVDAEGKPISIPPMRNLRDNYREIIDELAEIKLPYLVCASTPIDTKDEVKASTDVLNMAAEAAKKAGITLAYHNHDKEFKSVEDMIPYEYFLSQTSDKVMKMELDLAWCMKGGADPVALFKKHPGRFPLWHVKDIDKEGKIQPVGKGILDFKPIFEAAGKAGLKHIFVEHDFPADAVASINESSAYINKNLNL
jgi:sugar phosphate isomerase/epimerase